MQPSWGICAWAAPALSRVDDIDAAQRATVHTVTSVDALLQGDIEQCGLLGRRALADLVRFTAAYCVAMVQVSLMEVYGDPAAAMAVLGEGRCLLAAEGGSDDWRTIQLQTATSFVAGLVGDGDTARAEAHRAVAVARRLAIPTLLATALTIQGHWLCADHSPDALAAIDEAIGLFDTGAGDLLFATALMDAAVLRAVSGDPAGTADAARRAVDYAAHNGSRVFVADAVAVATLVLAGRPKSGAAAATANGARRGSALGLIPSAFRGDPPTPHRRRRRICRRHAEPRRPRGRPRAGRGDDV